MTAAIGIDIGGTNLRIGRVGADGSLSRSTSETLTRDADRVVARLIALCAALDGPDVRSVGIGIPGRVDTRRGQIFSGGYLDLTSCGLVQRLEDLLGKPVSVDNDGTMALVAEMAVGAARGASSVVMLTIGTGIGGAIALDGRVVRGRATAGQLGHLTVAQDGLLCACGRRGCVETLSSGTALRRHIAAAGLPGATRVEDVLERALAGDKVAAGVLTRWAGPLRDLIDSLAAAVDPDRVVLGGGLGGAACRALAPIAPQSEWFRPAIVAADLGDDAGVIGAGLTALLGPLA